MGKLSLREAVKVFDVSRPTLLKALKIGNISGQKDGKGRWEIDASELTRVYHPRKSSVEEVDMEKGVKFYQNPNALDVDLNVRLAQLEAELRVEKAARMNADELANERARHLDDLRRLLPGPKPEASQKKSKGWWPW